MERRDPQGDLISPTDKNKIAAGSDPASGRLARGEARLASVNACLAEYLMYKADSYAPARRLMYLYIDSSLHSHRIHRLPSLLPSLLPSHLHSYLPTYIPIADQLLSPYCIYFKAIAKSSSCRHSKPLPICLRLLCPQMSIYHCIHVFGPSFLS